jgi:LemA protein
VSTLVVVLVVTVVVAVAVIGWIVATYNGLVRRRNAVTNAWSQIEVQLKRRYDLIPNLVETVRGYATHERQTFDSVTAARAAAVNAQGPAEQAKAENALSTTLRSLFAVSEAYPQLQASQNFLQLQQSIVDTEDKIQASRRFYNGGVRELNTKIKVFPNNLFARNLGFTEREFFEVVDGAAISEPPRVQF